MRPLVELDHVRHCSVEERAVVRDDHGRPCVRPQERFQPCEPRKVEVVRRLVEEQDVEAAEQDRRKRRAGRLAT
jgi:hypothetical protein